MQGIIDLAGFDTWFLAQKIVLTVGIVDYLGNYMNGGYVQADLIRNEIIIEDAHQLDDIYIELTKGVYM